MSGSAEDRLYGLIAVADEQQAAVRAALAGLAAQEAALKRERLMLADGVAALRDEIAIFREATRAVGPELQRGTREAVRIAVADSLAGAGDTAARAVEASSRPLLDRLAGVAASAQEVEASLKRVVGWATWRLLGRIAAVAGGCLLVIVLANVSLRWWSERDLAFELAQKTLLESEIIGLQSTRDELVKAGMLARISHCNPGARPCIRVNEAAGSFGEPADYRIIQGY